jgi:hypothetical protein
MKISKRGLLFLLAIIILAGAVTLFVLYRGQTSEQDKLKTDLDNKNRTIQLLTLQQHSLEDDLADLEASIAAAQDDTGQLQAEINQKQAELERLKEERIRAEAEAIAQMEATGAQFLSLVESIEYSEILFGFAGDNGIELQDISTDTPSLQDVDGIKYYTASISLSLSGSSEGMLNFLKTIVDSDDFKTAIVEGFDLSVPEPLTAYEKEEIKGSIRNELLTQALAGITTAQLVDFITDALAAVCGPKSDWPDKIETQTVAEMAAVIESKLDEMVEAEYKGQLSEVLAELIEEYIADNLVNTIISPLANEIADLIVASGDSGPSHDDLVELLGEDITELLGDGIVGMLPGDIASLLEGYVTQLVEAYMIDSVDDGVEAQLQPLADQQITALEMPSSQLSLVIYTYKVG